MGICYPSMWLPIYNLKIRMGRPELQYGTLPYAFNKSTQLLSFQASHLKPLEKADHVQEMYRDGAKGNSLLNPVAGCGGMSGIGKIKMEKKLNESS